MSKPILVAILLADGVLDGQLLSMGVMSDFVYSQAHAHHELGDELSRRAFRGNCGWWCVSLLIGLHCTTSHFDFAFTLYVYMITTATALIVIESIILVRESVKCLLNFIIFWLF